MPPPAQQFEVVNDEKIEDKKIAKRTGLKRKVIKQIVKNRLIAKRTGLKRKTIRIPKKNYTNPLNAEKVILKKIFECLSGERKKGQRVVKGPE